MFWKGNNVLVTGVNGFLASHLAKKLLDLGASVVGLVFDESVESDFYNSGLDEKVRIVKGSVCEYEKMLHTLNEFEIDTVFHLGAQTQVVQAYNDPLETFETNIRGTYLLLEACRKYNPKLLKTVLVASSDKAYGNSEILPYRESSPLHGDFPYDVSKSCTDLLARSYFKTYDLPIGIIRSANIYGPGDYNFERLIPYCIRCFYFDERPKLRSDGSFLRNYIFVDDIVDGYLSLGEEMESQKLYGEAFNFGTPDSFIVLYVVSLIAKIMGKEDLKPIVLNQSCKEILDQKLCYEKASKHLNWVPKTSFQEGLQKTVNSYVSRFTEMEVIV